MSSLKSFLLLTWSVTSFDSDTVNYENSNENEDNNEKGENKVWKIKNRQVLTNNDNNLYILIRINLKKPLFFSKLYVLIKTQKVDFRITHQKGNTHLSEKIDFELIFLKNTRAKIRKSSVWTRKRSLTKNFIESFLLLT